MTDEPDYSSYADACQRASLMGNFEFFRQDPDIIKHLDPTIEQPGIIACRYLLLHHDSVLAQLPWNIYQKIDRLGNPELIDFPSLRDAGVAKKWCKMSHTVLRYICVSLAIIDHLQEGGHNFIKRISDHISIVEVGGAYGGQCAVLLATLTHFYPHQTQEYSIIDLPGVVELQRAFVNTLGLVGVTCHTNEDYPMGRKYHLFISSYCMGDVSEEVRDKYTQEIVMESEKGFITWSGCTVSDALRRCTIADEVPLLNPTDKAVCTVKF